jgi:hypothetical protein
MAIDINNVKIWWNILTCRHRLTDTEPQRRASDRNLCFLC